MSLIKSYNGKAIVKLKHIYICLDMETGNVLAKGTFADCNKALTNTEEVLV